MAADVDVQMPGIIVPDPVVSGGPVRGSQWAQCARAINYLLGGTNRTLIPHSYVASADKASGSNTLRYKIWPSYQATHRVWILNIESTVQVESLTFTDPSGGSSDWEVSGSVTRVHVETISSRTDAETNVTLTYTTAADTSIVGLACYEVRRPSLALNTSDYGIDVGTFRGGAPIYNGTGLSFGALHDSLEEARGMRRILHAWASARDGNSPAITSGTDVALFSYDMPLLDRQLYRSETQVDVTVWAYTRSGAGTTGTFTFTMTNTDFAAISVTAADTGTWRLATVAVDAEDLTASDGRRSTRFDQCAITAKRTAGANSVYVDSVIIVGRAT